MRRVRRRGSESGFVLIDALVISLLVTLVFMSLILGLLTAVRSSEVNRHRQRMEAALTSYGESVRNMPHYLPCQLGQQPGTFGTWYTNVNAVTMGWTSPDGMTVKVLNPVEVLDPASGAWSTSCPPARGGAGVADSGAQRLTVEVSSQGKVLTGQIVKTRPLA